MRALSSLSRSLFPDEISTVIEYRFACARPGDYYYSNYDGKPLKCEIPRLKCTSAGVCFSTGKVSKRKSLIFDEFGELRFSYHSAVLANEETFIRYADRKMNYTCKLLKSCCNKVFAESLKKYFHVNVNLLSACYLQNNLHNYLSISKRR